ncbi:MAG: branched-chain amino acid ABC transporter permease, partial [Trueperaceae bacterium]|nr:branched-chain amino acid ABC transporter permease [Trueperaceae bacterium]
MSAGPDRAGGNGAGARAYRPHYLAHRVRNSLLTLAGLAVLLVVLLLVDGGASVKLKQVFALFAIWGIATVSLNLVNGVTGILSLGHHGFMLIGGYVTGLLVLPAATRDNLARSARSELSDFAMGLSVENWFRALGLDSLTTPETLWARFLVAVLIGGLMAALFGVVVGFPSLRLRGDYLAIVTFAFGEAVRLLASTPMMSSFTNGALGFAGVPSDIGKSVWWTFGFL